ncbi:TPA: N-acetyltransferase [Vibrio parahaemolyticus]|uniref:N-acetyltransferase n=1 Tax=Vibrio parahaemolyticus TaxID=670 RepID=UPI001A8D42C7|nr:N-acetyltransferase [Vibrio parahaemolyticus]MBO0159891.1 N-acetyltransferase [Vibrio parahaemolyticus]MBO0175101.1 N-acetyltransferase [Vibrio parahaemolyticus]MCX8859939.1 N-acetyltransferase [Vibrio parahaemolyticus]MCX8865115.1 N-acetyltransferase [Vibrio parahaemolyticus]MCX8870240.1 N-acetyltransferase [Vibrio parahaemolyticus]
MIRKYNENDMGSVLEIWLNASVKAHDFISPEFWEFQVENMRNIYIPASETYVYEVESKVVGFYALYENSLAAIFVSPVLQGKGIGKQLLSHATTQKAGLSLSVYKENQASYQFYLSQGFKVVSEQLDEHTGHPEYTMSSGI